MSEKQKIETDATKLHERLIRLRELKGDSRLFFCRNILSFLEHKEEWNMDKIDALLIKAIEKKFGKFNIEADITLMALGLLEGFSYNEYPMITERREQFVEKSPYLKKRGCSDDKNGENNEDSQKKALDRLRKKDTNNLEYLAEFLVEYKGKVDEFLNDIDDYLDEESFAILPTPSYIKRKPLRDRIKKAVIKYFLSGRQILTLEKDIVINKNNEYEIKVDLTKDANAILSVIVACIILCISLPIYTTFYIQKDTLSKSQELNIEYQTRDDTGRKYQTKDDIMGVLERTGQKLEVRPYTLGSSSENGNTVSPF